MPKITLRLTDEQHAQLSAQAARAHRSIQGECIHRLFPPPIPGSPESVGLRRPDDVEPDWKPSSK